LVDQNNTPESGKDTGLFKLKKTQLWVQLSSAAEGAANGGHQARWCLLNTTLQALQHGSVEQLASWLQQQQLPDAGGLHTVLLCSGDTVITRQLAFAAKEKKHLQRLLPFMLEPELATDLSYVHVASGEPRVSAGSGQVDVVYTEKRPLQTAIQALENLGLDVEAVYSLPSMLPGSSGQWSLLVDGDICHLRCGNIVCTSVEPALLLPLLETMLAEQREAFSGTCLTVFASDAEKNSPTLLSLYQSLHEMAGLQRAGITLSRQSVPQVWSALVVTGEHRVNLRQGELSAPLRLARYWKPLRTPVIAAMLAVCAVISSVFVETLLNQRRFAALETQIEQRYRQVMPDGVLVDPVQQLATQLTRYRAADSSAGPVSMLNAMLDAFDTATQLNLHRLSYTSNEQNNPEIQMTISAPTTAGILELSERLSASGLTAQAQNISRAGDLQQANLIVRGNGL
jgi:general secretion pathway protein L